MAGSFSLTGFAAFAAGMVLTVDHLKHEALEKAAVVLEKESKRVLGTYDYGWPQLAQSTQDRRTQLGFSANDPLLRTGELKDSIQHNSDSSEAYVGSDEDKAVWQEMGTPTIPPRSFLAQAAIHKEKEIVHEIGSHIAKLLAP